MKGINQRVYDYKIVRDEDGILKFEHRIVDRKDHCKTHSISAKRT